MSFLTLSPADFFELAYLPAVSATVLANDEIIDDVAKDPALEHAVAFARRAVRMGADVGASEKLKTKFDALGFALAWSPSTPAIWRKWLTAIQTAIGKELAPVAAYAMVQRAAFDAGVAAGDAHIALLTGRNTISLRTTAPTQQLLAQKAAEIEANLKDAMRRLLTALASTSTTETVAIAADLSRATLPAIATAAEATAYKAFCDAMTPLIRQLDLLSSVFLSYDKSKSSVSESIPTSAPSGEERRLLSEIIERPDDNALRANYATLAAKRVDPRADLIRTQLAIVANKLDPYGIRSYQYAWKKRADALIKQHPEWTEDVFNRGAKSVELCRGFVGRVEIAASDFLKNAATLFQEHPIQHVQLHAVVEDLARLVESPFLDRINSLILNRNDLTDAHVKTLISTPRLRNLRYLSLSENKVTNAGLEALAASPNLSALKCLRVADNPCDPMVASELYNETDYNYFPTPFAVELEKRFGKKTYLSDTGILFNNWDNSPDELYAQFFYH